MVFFCFAGYRVHGEDDTIGPTFIKEPPNKIDFSNSTGATLECTVRGNPAPEIIWLRSDGTAVGEVPGLRQVNTIFISLHIVIVSCKAYQELYRVSCDE